MILRKKTIFERLLLNGTLSLFLKKIIHVLGFRIFPPFIWKYFLHFWLIGAFPQFSSVESSLFLGSICSFSSFTLSQCLLDGPPSIFNYFIVLFFNGLCIPFPWLRGKVDVKNIPSSLRMPFPKDGFPFLVPFLFPFPLFYLDKNLRWCWKEGFGKWFGLYFGSYFTNRYNPIFRAPSTRRLHSLVSIIVDLVSIRAIYYLAFTSFYQFKLHVCIVHPIFHL